jgi:hypothetical protein
VFRCVLGSEGRVLVSRSSGTPMATWAWSILVVSRRRVLEAMFILLEFPSPSRIIFISSHSLPHPLSGSLFRSFTEPNDSYNFLISKACYLQVVCTLLNFLKRGFNLELMLRCAPISYARVESRATDPSFD